jgi:hypothetical protein
MYFETGHWCHDFLADRMTGSGRVKSGSNDGDMRPDSPALSGPPSTLNIGAGSVRPTSATNGV